MYYCYFKVRTQVIWGYNLDRKIEQRVRDVFCRIATFVRDSHTQCNNVHTCRGQVYKQLDPKYLKINKFKVLHLHGHNNLSRLLVTL